MKKTIQVATKTQFKQGQIVVFEGKKKKYIVKCSIDYKWLFKVKKKLFNTVLEEV